MYDILLRGDRMFDDDFMNDMLLNPDLYGIEEDEEKRQKDEKNDECDEEE